MARLAAPTIPSDCRQHRWLSTLFATGAQQFDSGRAMLPRAIGAQTNCRISASAEFRIAVNGGIVSGSLAKTSAEANTIEDSRLIWTARKKRGLRSR